MTEFIRDNIGTAAVAVSLAVGVFFALRKLFRDMRSGKHCGSGCPGCPMNGHCNKENSDKE